MSATNTAAIVQQPPAFANGPSESLLSLFELAVSGGPIMVPLLLCSLVAVAYAFERWLRLRPSRLGRAGLAAELAAALRSDGPARARDLCRERPTVLARMLGAGLERAGAGRAEVEKALEDAGSREARALVHSLRPLSVVTAIAPLLGLLGTVWGIILCFSKIGAGDALGRPEALANGISQALVTTAAGLVIAIPSQAVYFALRARVDRFVKSAEEEGDLLSGAIAGAPLPASARAALPAADAPSAAPIEPSAAAAGAVLA